MRRQDRGLHDRVEAPDWHRHAPAAIPARVSLRLEPVSESDTGKTFIALSASADSAMMPVARRSQWS